MAEYPDFVETCGYGSVTGIGGANCRHSFHPFVEGVSERTYTDEQLANIDPPPFNFEGKEYTAYEATQKQRQIERTIRKQKRLKTAYESAGIKEDAQAANIKLRRLNQKYKEFSNAAGLPDQLERVKVLNAGGASTRSIEISLANAWKSDIIKSNDSFVIGVSLGAKAKNYEVIDKHSGIVYRFVEGTRIKNPTVFAGYKVKNPLRQETVEGLVEEFGGSASKWQHAKGIGILDVDGEGIKAEIHWFQEETVGKVKFKVKEWLYD